MKSKVLKLGLPKGSLQESTFKMLKKAGFNVNLSSSRSYFPSVDDPQIQAILLRAQEMSRYVQDGALDCGITGNDWILENNSKWDKRVNVLQVTNATDRSVELRALMSAVDSSTLWDLRCEVREKLLEFLQRRFPECLPRMRIEANKNAV